MRKISPHIHIGVLVGLAAITIATLSITSQTSYASTHEIQGIHWNFPIPASVPIEDSQYGHLNKFSARFYETTNWSNNTIEGFTSYWNTSINNGGACDYYETIDTHVYDGYSASIGFYSAIDGQTPNCISNTGFDTQKPIYVDSLPNSPLTDWLGLGYQSLRDFYVQKLHPYWFLSDGFYTKQHWIDSSDTSREYTGFLDFYQLFPNLSPRTHSLRDLSLPLYNSITEDDCVPIQNYDTLTFNLQFYLGENYELNSNIDYSNSDFYFDVQYYGYNPDGMMVHSEYFTCTPYITGIQSEYGTGYYLRFDNCDIDIDYISQSYPYVQINLRWVVYDENNLPTWFIHSDEFDLAGLVVIDGGDPSGTGCAVGDDLHGSQIPGEAIPDDNNGSTDGGLLSQLSNLFHFNVINPIAPIFELFTDGSQCAYIPTLAGMLLSPQDTVCPWFSSETRQIVTPVLGLAATLLVFGFVVRWLSSSSGNYSDDSRSDK